MSSGEPCNIDTYVLQPLHASNKVDTLHKIAYTKQEKTYK